MIDLTSKFGEINDIEHNKGSKIYTQNQVILDCIMQRIQLKHHSEMGLCFSYVSSNGLYKKIKKSNFFLLFLIGKIRHGIGKKGGYFRLGMGPKLGP